MNAKTIAWMLVSATGLVTAAGFFIPQLGFALASVMFGGLALATSLFAQRPVKYKGEKRIETGLV